MVTRVGASLWNSLVKRLCISALFSHFQNVFRTKFFLHERKPSIRHSYSKIKSEIEKIFISYLKSKSVYIILGHPVLCFSINVFSVNFSNKVVFHQSMFRDLYSSFLVTLQNLFVMTFAFILLHDQLA